MDYAYHLMFNGDLYNYVELQDELTAQGDVVRTYSDSKVLLRA